MARKIGYLWIALFVFSKIYQNLFIAPVWFSSYADDLLFIPIVLGSALFVQQKLVDPNFVFNKLQIWVSFIVFSVVFEGVFPFIINGFTFDPLDILMYFLGTILFQFTQHAQHEKVNE